MNSIEHEKFCMEIPKAELHIHIEGSFEPELMFKIAKRNKIEIPFKSVEEIREKYNFKNLQEFLDIYYAACDVLKTEDDYEELVYEYLKKSFTQGLVYCEIFFDPQSHLPRGVSFETLINGLNKGREKGLKDFRIKSQLIMCFLRHLSENEAIETLEAALPFKESILAIGLDSSEVGHPPEKFTNVYKLAKEQGYRLCAHAGEEGTCQNIKKAIINLGVERIDHGIAIFNDLEYLKQIASLEKPIPFTMCPLSNYKLQVTPDLSIYPLRVALENNLMCTINSDDPAYFGGYVGDNFVALYKNIKLTYDEIIKLAKNSFLATFLDESEKKEYLERVDEYQKTSLNKSLI